LQGIGHGGWLEHRIHIRRMADGSSSLRIIGYFFCGGIRRGGWLEHRIHIRRMADGSSSLRIIGYFFAGVSAAADG
jgi:hypothetical protein